MPGSNSNTPNTSQPKPPPKPSASGSPSPTQGLTLQQKRDVAAKKVERFTKAQSLQLSPPTMALVGQWKRMAEAELRLRDKALEYATPHPDPEIEQKLSLYRLLHLPIPNLGQEPSGQTSTKPETFGSKTSPM